MKGKFRKILLITLSITLLIGLAGFNTHGVKAEDNNNDTSKEYTYNVNGIKLISNVPLTKEELKQFEKELKRMEKESKKTEKDKIKDSDTIVSPQMITDPGNQGVIIEGPVYTYADPGLTNEITNLIVAWVTSRLPYKITKSTLFNWTFNKLTGWLTVKEPTPIGYWIWRLAGDPPGCYSEYQTLALYEKGSNFKKMKTFGVYKLNTICP